MTASTFDPPRPLLSGPGLSPAPPSAPPSARLLAVGDSAARNAFRVGLRTDTPEPIAAAAASTQELDPNDILEVQDIAQAIARAEWLLPCALPSSPERPTDDIVGPAIPAPPYLELPCAPLTAIDARPRRWSLLLLAALLPLVTALPVARLAHAPRAHGWRLDAAVRAPTSRELSRTPLETSSLASKLSAPPSEGKVTSAGLGPTPVFDVNRLPAARPRSRR